MGDLSLEAQRTGCCDEEVWNIWIQLFPLLFHFQPLILFLLCPSLSLPPFYKPCHVRTVKKNFLFFITPFLHFLFAIALLHVPLLFYMSHLPFLALLPSPSSSFFTVLLTFFFFTSPLVFFLFTLSKSNRLSLFLIESLPSSSETHSSSQTDRGTEVRHTNTVW